MNTQRKLVCIKLTFHAFGQERYCYTENTSEALESAENAIHELCDTSCIIQTEVTLTDPDDFVEHSIDHLTAFIKAAKYIEDDEL